MTVVRFLVPYYGAWPVWLPATLLSCARNEAFEWHVFTDLEPPPYVPPNVFFHALDEETLRYMASEFLGITVKKPDTAYVIFVPRLALFLRTGFRAQTFGVTATWT